MAPYLHSVQDEGILLELAKAIRHQRCILLIGLGLALSTEKTEDLSQRHLKELLSRMIQWCVEQNKLDNEQIADDFRQLLQDGELEKVERKLQEYLVGSNQRMQCIHDVMRQGQQQTKAIYQYLCQMSFRGYITTSYDEFLEQTYKEVKEFPELIKFYKASIEEAVVSYREKQPFILKLHGDVDSPETITLSNRFARSSPPVVYPEQLRGLLADEYALFLGFEKTDPDLKGLKSFVNSKDHLKRWLVIPEGHLTEEEARVLYEKEQMTILSYTGHTELVDFLQELHKQATTPQQVNGYISYADASQDRRMCDRLKKHLSNVKCQGLEIVWKDGIVKAGEEVRGTIEERLKNADIILLLVSADYLASIGERNVEIEIARAVQRHRRGQARIIPIILRACGWDDAPFANLSVLPSNKVPIEQVSKREQAYTEVRREIKLAIEKWAREH